MIGKIQKAKTQKRTKSQTKKNQEAIEFLLNGGASEQPKTTKTGRINSIPIPIWKEFKEFLSANELELNDIEKRELYMMREYSDVIISLQVQMKREHCFFKSILILMI